MTAALPSLSAAMPPRGQRLAVWRAVSVACMLGVIALITFVPLSANDFWLQAKIGEMIWRNGEIPQTVLFPFTPVRDFHFNSHEWLASVLFHLLDRSLGYERLLFVQGLLGLALFGLTARLAWRLSGSLACALLLAGGAMVLANYRHHLRPELLALPLMVAILGLLYDHARTGRLSRLAWTLPLTALWANVHGSFLLAPVLAGLFALGAACDALREAQATDMPAERVRRALRAGAPAAALSLAMVLASLLNPHGWGLLQFAVSFSQSEVAKAYIKEWAPTLSAGFMATPTFRAFAVGLALSVLALVRWRRHVRATDLLLLACFGTLALLRCRFIVLYGFIAAAVLARLIGASRWAPTRERPLLAATVLAAAVGTGLALRYGNLYGAYPYFADSDDFTPQMMQRLESPQMHGNVFNSYELGAQLIYCCYPRLRPSEDSRIDSYGPGYFLAMDGLLKNEPLLMQFVDEYHVDYMLLLWRDFHFIEPMQHLRASGWRLRFGDHRMVLLERTPPAAAPQRTNP